MKLTRDSKSVLQQLTTVKSQVIAKAACKIQVPARYMDVGLGQIGIETFVLGALAVILEDGKYAVLNINGLVELDPYKTLEVNIANVPYYEFYFNPGDVVIKSTDIVKRDTLIYNVFDEFIFKGKVPWYLEYEDLGKLFDSAKLYANSRVGSVPEIIELIASLVTRPVNDRVTYLRTVLDSYKGTQAEHIAFVPLISVFYSVNSTMNKLAGAYFNDGVTSALVTPTDKVGQIESILRA